VIGASSIRHHRFSEDAKSGEAGEGLGHITQVGEISASFLLEFTACWPSLRWDS